MSAAAGTVRDEELRPLVGKRNGHTPALTELWEEMTSVRRSQPAGTTW